MDKLNRRERFAKKYSSAGGAERKEMNVMGRRGPGGMMRGGGKPKNALKTFTRLLGYLSHERKLLIFALISALVYTVASLTSSYMLRPVLNLLTEEGRTPTERMRALAVGIFSCLSTRTVRACFTQVCVRWIILSSIKNIKAKAR